MVKNRFQNLKDFFKFQFTAGNLHGLHSPFMYDFARFVLYDKKNYAAYKYLKAYNRQLKKINDYVDVKDLGAGSRFFLSQNRQIKDIAKVAGSSYADMKRLYRISQYFQPEHMLELGTSLGKATLALSLGHPTAKLTTVEGDPVIAKTAENFLKQYPVGHLDFVTAPFDEFLKDINQTNKQYDLIFLDGHHNYKPTLQYFEQLLPHIHNDTVFIIDDIYWSEKMKKAWRMLKQHPAVCQSLDTYYFGILFFRKEQAKQHFKINLLSFNLF